MSRWNEFGFPHLAGVPLGVALEGIFLAAMERLQLTGSYSERDNYYNQQLYQRLFKSGQTHYRAGISAVEAAVEALVLNGNLGYVPCDLVLPDCSIASIQNMWKYLGEEYIAPPDLTTTGLLAAYGNQGFVTGNWLLQRYRMLNNVYSGVVHDGNITSIKKGWSGEGKTFAEAVDKAKEQDYYFFPDGAVFYYEYQKDSQGTTVHRVKKVITITEKIKYPFYKPADLFVEILPERYDMWLHKYQGGSYGDVKLPYVSYSEPGRFRESIFDPMGLDVVQGEPAVSRQYELAEIKYGDEVSLEDIAGPLFEYVKNSNFITPERYVADHQDIERGINLNAKYRFDFRKVLEFYDPAEATER